ncbi:major facilitator superfamily domain-containing protein [Lipomyces doorenjongii]|uniref:major facilitator superfamily domain-containing protein n=1 Tax=Lipomyces doorenjongii TaxID=383834 RepID=UPI0034CD278B
MTLDAINQQRQGLDLETAIDGGDSELKTSRQADVINRSTRSGIQNEGNSVKRGLVRFVSLLWDSFGKDAQTQKYLHKIDLFILIYVMLSYLIKSLDNTNINNAYVSGMQEDLALYGNELNLFATFFNMGYLSGSIPFQYIVSHFRPSIIVPSCELVWSGLVMLVASVKSAKSVYVLRYFIGLVEAAAFPVFMQVLGSWYTPEELGKRVAIFDMCANIAAMFSGYLQAGLYTSFNGRGGLAGWRWLFIMDGVISFPIALLGFYCLPDFPTNTRARWLTKEEKEFSIRRFAAVGKKGPRKLTLRRLGQYVLSWRPYGCLCFVCTASGGDAPSASFNLWLKSLDMSIQKVNIIPTAANACAIGSAFVFGSLSDRTRTRWPWIIFGEFIRISGNVILAVWNVNYSSKFYAYLAPSLATFYWTLWLSWSQEAFQDDAEFRGLVMAGANTIGPALGAFVPLLLFPTEQAPHYHYGFYAAIAFNTATIGSVLLFHFLSKREAKKRGRVYNEFGLTVDPSYEAELLRESGIGTDGYHSREEPVIEEVSLNQKNAVTLSEKEVN